jgi:isoamylase
MVKLLHTAGLEVILDVVYNHTAEGTTSDPPSVCAASTTGPTTGSTRTTRPLRELDRAPGNTLDLGSPPALQTGDGQPPLLGGGDARRRFPLRSRHHAGHAPTLTSIRWERSSVRLPGSRTATDEADRRAVGRRTDGVSGRRVPARWSEWNDTFRDTVRDFWKGTDSTLGALGDAVTGSSPLVRASGRTPTASVNIVTSHDGFTLPTSSPTTTAQRRQRRSTIATVITTTGRGTPAWRDRPTTPTVLEIRASPPGRCCSRFCCPRVCRCCSAATNWGGPSSGNNNAYNQDNEISWFDWEAPTPTSSPSLGGSRASAGITRPSAGRPGSTSTPPPPTTSSGGSPPTGAK